ncbi:MAG: hypothetical protein WCO63_00765 [Bacteroidota bacterium]
MRKVKFKLKIYILLILPASLLFGLVLSSFAPSPPSRISLVMETKMMTKGKALIVNAEVFYQFDQGRMLTHYTRPLDYLFITNNKGEAKVYFPASNEVMLKQSAEFDTEKGILFFFLSNKLSDLGLADMGFKPGVTRKEDGLVISTWTPPSSLTELYSKVELVHENFRPIYIAWYDAKKMLMKKIFYYDYATYADFTLPMKVVEIGYLSKKDSTISKITYSDVKTGAQANNAYFNFKIPVNAKVKSS